MSQQSVYGIYTVTGGTTVKEYETTGSGAPRLFEGDGVYVYGLYGLLLNTRDIWGTVNNIMPAGLPTITAMCQADIDVTIVFAPGRASDAFLARGRYQSVPETPSGWNAIGALETQFAPVDAVSDLLGVGPALVGNGISTSTQKILRNAQDEPYSTWIESDSGLPQSGATSGITDLEISE